LVELALVAPLVMALLLGVFTGGNAYFQKVSLVDAARDGARYGATLKVPAGGIAAWKQSVADRVAQLSGGQLASGEVCADLVTPTGTNTACGVSDPKDAEKDPTVNVVPCTPGACVAPASVVKVSVAKTAKIEFLFFTSTPALTARVASRYERDLL
ncbi:MAG: pilus assembly protein, partial [Actinobacteria bacterium]|nr:pilus assembly protein [Actinomycetota bacterium]